MILYNLVKQYKCKHTNNYYLGKGGGGKFHNVFNDKPTKWPIAKKKTHQNICALGCTTTNLIN
jgi:hypothetical protein